MKIVYGLGEQKTRQKNRNICIYYMIGLHVYRTAFIRIQHTALFVLIVCSVYTLLDFSNSVNVEA